MVNETIERIETRINANDGMSPENRKELLALVLKLKKEVSTLAETHDDDARSVIGFAETSVHEATRLEVNPELLSHSLDGMTLSVRRFEVSHPKLIDLINTIGQTLRNIGL
jgi:hypothetical protein